MRLSAVVPILGALVGFLVVYLSSYTVSPTWASYISLATLAGVDSICGGVRAGLEGKFHDDIFLTGFAMNTLLAGFLAYLGDRIGVDLFLAAVVLLGGRVFLNLSLIRRYWLNQAQMVARRKDVASS
jgi:small basic protein